jgi:thiol-disulfide isomerase/thioredoxin
MEQRGSRLSRWIRNGLWLLVVVAVLYFWFSHGYSIRIVSEERAPAASALALTDLDGRSVDLRDYRGKVVLLNLWAGWCPPCRAEIPGLSRLDRKLRSRGLVVLGLNTDSEPAERVAQLGERLGVTYRIVLANGPLSGTFASSGVLPHTWLIDRQGRVRASHAGWATERSFRRACERLLAER